jgi:drug/metabolite transporter (DMT)-like permease
MFWIFVAILCAFFTALSDILCKIFIEKRRENGLSTLFVRWFFVIPFIIPFVFTNWQKIDLKYLVLYFVGIPLEIIAAYFYMKALEISEASLVLPFQSITPIFIPLFSIFVLDDKYSLYGLGGVLLVVAGSFIILKSANSSGLEQLKGKKSSDMKAVFLMILSSLIYSFTSVLGRYLALHIDPIFFGSTYMLSNSIIFSVIFLLLRKEKVKLIKPDKLSLLIGITMGIAVITHFVAISKIEAAYMISIKRTSILFSVVLSKFFLQDKEFGKRFEGALLMLLGVIIVSLAVK